MDIERLTPDRQALLERLLQQRRSTVLEPASPEPMRISLFFFSADLDDAPRDKYRLVLRCAELADELGLDAVWVPERHFDPFGGPYPAPAVLLAAIAARTSQIALRAGSVVLPLHDPLLVAEEFGVLDAISEGRVGLSLASGWHADDFVLRPDAYHQRKEVLVQGVSDLRTLWYGKSVPRTGPDDRLVETSVYPRPERPLELWLTSSGNVATWRTAGALNVSVLTALLEQSVEEIAVKTGEYRDALAAAGHHASGHQVTCMLHTHLARNDADVAGRVREPLVRYLSAHLNLFAKFAAAADVGIRPEDVTEADRKLLLEHGLQRYLHHAGLFGTAETCLPMVDRLAGAGVTELGCLVDFGLPDDHVFECVQELGRLRTALHDRVAR